MNKKSVQNNRKQDFSPKNDKQNNNMFFPVKKEILGVGVTDASEGKILEYVINFIENSSKNAYIVTPNPEMIVESTKNPPFKNALNGADLALCDGMGLFLAGQLVGKPLTSRIIGTNFVERLCEKVANRPITVGFLGGTPGVAVKTAECLKKQYPKLLVGFAGEEWKETKLDILFVAFGAPKQELWMAEHLNKIPVRVMMGVGGAFDQIVNPSLRAPHYINSIGMGWLFRLVREPWRIKRQMALLQFIFLLIKTILSLQ